MDNDILDSWKGISSYLGRDVRTCINWERDLGLPVHRINPGSSRSKVFAYRHEIDQWLKGRSAGLTGNRPAAARRKSFSVRALLGVLLCAAVFLAYGHYSLRKEAPAAAGRTVRLALLPFEGQDGSAAEERFAADLSLSLADQLSLFRGIRVVPPSFFTSDGAAAGPRTGPREKPDIDFFLKGKVSAESGRFRLAVELLDGRDDRTIWRSEYSGRTEELLYSQYQLCGSITALLISSPRYEGGTPPFTRYDTEAEGLVPGSPAAPPDGRNDPWKAYFQGRYYLERLTEEANKKAVVLFSRIIEKDREFAPAYAGLAECYTNLVNFHWDFDPAWLDKAMSLLDRAQAISPDLPEYYLVRVKVLLLQYIDFDRDTKKAALETALKGVREFPDQARLNSTLGFYYYLCYGERGDRKDLDRAIEFREKSFWFDPGSPSNIIFVEMLTTAGRFIQALDMCRTMERGGAAFMARLKAAQVHYYLGELEESGEILKELESMSLEHDLEILCFEGMIAARNGMKARSISLIEDIERVSPYGHLVMEKLFLASIYGGLGMQGPCRRCLAEFFSGEVGSKFRHVGKRYIELDPNFRGIKTSDL